MTHTPGLHPICEMCDKPLEVYGAILLSPPAGSNRDKGDQTVSKYHICVGCYSVLIEKLKADTSQKEWCEHRWTKADPDFIKCDLCGKVE